MIEISKEDYARKLATIARNGCIELKRSKGPNGETIIQSADVDALAGLLTEKADLTKSKLQPYLDQWKASKVL